MSVASDEEALMAAIDAAPFDDAPRLVYADWCQECGDETKADYLQTVVRLMHSPEDRVDLERCVSLAESLDQQWRQRVGARFEMMVDGELLRLAAYAVRTLLKMAGLNPIDFSRLHTPITLKTEVTREEAEQLFDSYQRFHPRVRVMNKDSGPDLFAP